MKRISSKLKRLLPAIQKNVSLKNYTTFKIGGRAKYFFEAKNKEDLIKAVITAKKFNPSPFPKGDRVKLPFFILGGGSNILVADKGYNGLVINFQFSIFNFQSISNSKIFKIVVGAGLPLGKLVNASAEKSLTGLEWVVGIPGQVGGAIYGNAGAFGSCMADVVESVEVLDIQDNKIRNPKSEILNKSQIPNPKFQIRILKNRDCKFGYRESIFKHEKNLIILSATLHLRKGNKKEIKNKIQKNLEQRKKVQPLNFPSAGSVFKNPVGFSASSSSTELPKETKVRKRMKFSCGFAAAWLIEKCGLKGKRIGNVKISEKHANFIVNLGGGKAKDVKKLINLAKKKVKEKFGITLEEEIVILSGARKNDPAPS